MLRNPVAEELSGLNIVLMLLRGAEQTNGAVELSNRTVPLNASEKGDIGRGWPPGRTRSTRKLPDEGPALQ